MSNVISITNSLDRLNRAFPTEPGYPSGPTRGGEGAAFLRATGMNGLADGYSTATSYDPNMYYDEFGNLIGSTPDGQTINWGALAPQTLQALKDLWIANRQADLQAQLLQINMVRAQRGEPPITQSMIGSLSPQVNVGISSDVQKMLMWGGVALLAVMLLNGRRRA